MAGKQKRPTIQVKPGDLALIGSPGITMPGDWFLATVLWVGPEDILVEQYGIGSQSPHRMVHAIEAVRAVGTIEALADYKRRCGAAVADAQKHVRECESALGAARQAVWAKLDEIAAQPEMATTD